MSIPGSGETPIVSERIRKYIENYENNEWEWDKYPDVYIVRKSVGDRRRLIEYVEKQMDDNYLGEDDFSFYIISKIDEIV